jgi:hypothetical protein
MSKIRAGDSCPQERSCLDAPCLVVAVKDMGYLENGWGMPSLVVLPAVWRTVRRAARGRRADCDSEAVLTTSVRAGSTCCGKPVSPSVAPSVLASRLALLGFLVLTCAYIVRHCGGIFFVVVTRRGIFDVL